MDHTEKIIKNAGQDGEAFVKYFLKKENIRRRRDKNSPRRNKNMKFKGEHGDGAITPPQSYDHLSLEERRSLLTNVCGVTLSNNKICLRPTRSTRTIRGGRCGSSGWGGSRWTWTTLTWTVTGTPWLSGSLCHSCPMRAVRQRVLLVTVPTQATAVEDTPAAADTGTRARGARKGDLGARMGVVEVQHLPWSINCVALLSNNCQF